MALGGGRRQSEANRLEYGWSEMKCGEKLHEPFIGYEVEERDEAQHRICQKTMTRQNGAGSVCYDIS